MNDDISECRNDLSEVEDYIERLENENKTLLRKNGMKNKETKKMERIWVDNDYRNKILEKSNENGEVILEAPMLYPVIIKVIGIEEIK